MSSSSANRITPAKRVAKRRGAASSVSKKTKTVARTVPRVLNNFQGAFPKQFRNTVRYESELLSVVLNGSGLGSYVVSCNGLYDPNVSGTGHQPLYFDQLTSIYNHYCVLKSKCSFQLVADIAFPVLMTVFQDDDATINVSAGHTARERPGAKTITCNPQQVGIFPTVTSYWNVYSVFPGNPLSRLELQGKADANPTEQTSFIFYLDAGAAGASQTVYFRFSAEYETVWDELTSVSGS